MKLSKQLLEMCGLEEKAPKQINENKEYIGIYEDWDEDRNEPGELGVLTITRDDNYIYAGYASNVGVNNQYKQEIDDTFSFDEQLQEFIEAIKYHPEDVE